MAQQWNLNPFEGIDFFFDQSRWLTPGEHKSKRGYEDIYGQLDPTDWEVPRWIGKWGEGAKAGAQQSYDQALSAALKRIAPAAAGRGMWSSPGVRGSLQTQAARPLQQALSRQLMGIDTQMAGMTGKAEQDWQNRELQKLLYQAGLIEKMGELGPSGSDIMSGIGGLGGAALGLWLGGPAGAAAGWGIGQKFGGGSAGQNRYQWA